ncbi:MAG: argininosuccinate synthase [Chitinophagaceae bacterium]|nr:MAG: argininosuccinate synthase [Chitinophagaceae bacterium]
MKKKVVLAFSGGLDTSFCCIYLAEDRGFEVHTVLVNTGGFSAEELEEIGNRAKSLGVASHAVVDETPGYYERCIKYLIYGNVLKNSTYPLSVSAERVFQASAIAAYVKEIGAEYVAHGSTGAGNDQVRFDMIFNILIPEVEIITPIRDLKLSREAEIEYLNEHGVEYNAQKATYSINKGLWGTSVGGKETLTSNEMLPESAWPTQLTASRPVKIELSFEQGELVALNNEKMSAVNVIQKLQDLAQPFGIGRDVHVGDTIIGIKGRVGFEAAAPVIIIKAHHALEKHTLTKWQLSWKEQLASFYGNWLHEGQFHDPVMRNLEAFLQDTQKTVTGTVFIELHPYRFTVLGIESPNDLMSNKFGSYGEMNNAWSGDDVKGFSKIFGNQTMIWHKVNGGHLDKNDNNEN